MLQALVRSAHDTPDRSRLRLMAGVEVEVCDQPTGPSFVFVTAAQGKG